MRIAFLTSEYPSEYSHEAKGLGTYVHRMARLLIESGHEPEVFVPSGHSSQTFTYDKVCVHRVNWKDSQLLPRLMFSTYKSRPVHRLLFSTPEQSVRRFQRWRSALVWIFQASALAAMLDRRHSEAPFSLVQSSDYQATGLFVRRRRDRVHAVRCSSATDLYSTMDGTTPALEWCCSYFERLSMKRADLAYAPSRYLAKYFIHNHRIDVRVIRPPRHFDVCDISPTTMPLPARFFFHFGKLMERKGTALLAQALPLAWRTAPDLTMVWSGPIWDQQKFEHWHSLWGDRAKQIHITGPLSKSELYAVLQKAEVAVLPSQIDNLPNTVIESLMFGIPVLGSRGASIDELVDEDQNGHLVDLGDSAGLAEALVKMWKKNSPVCKGFEWNTAIAEEMRPDRAVSNLISLARAKS